MTQSETILRDHVLSRPDSAVDEFVRYLDHKESKNTLKLTNIWYFGKCHRTRSRWIRELQLSDESVTYEKIVKEKCLHTSYQRRLIRSNNAFALTTDHRYIRIIKFIVDEVTMREYTLCNFIITENCLEDFFQ